MPWIVAFRRSPTVSTAVKAPLRVQAPAVAERVPPPSDKMRLSDLVHSRCAGALSWWPSGAEAELSAEEKKKLKHKKKREVQLGVLKRGRTNLCLLRRRRRRRRSARSRALVHD